MPSILDLPEPQRSRELAARGKTAEEFQAYLDGWKANEEALEERVANGTHPQVPDGKMHYGDDFPDPEVTDPEG